MILYLLLLLTLYSPTPITAHIQIKHFQKAYTYTGSRQELSDRKHAVGPLWATVTQWCITGCTPSFVPSNACTARMPPTNPHLVATLFDKELKTEPQGDGHLYPYEHLIGLILQKSYFGRLCAKDNQKYQWCRVLDRDISKLKTEVYNAKVLWSVE